VPWVGRGDHCGQAGVAGLCECVDRFGGAGAESLNQTGGGGVVRVMGSSWNPMSRTRSARSGRRNATWVSSSKLMGCRSPRRSRRSSTASPSRRTGRGGPPTIRSSAGSPAASRKRLCMLKCADSDVIDHRRSAGISGQRLSGSVGFQRPAARRGPAVDPRDPAGPLSARRRRAAPSS
jgi:hypothetical protein